MPRWLFSFLAGPLLAARRRRALVAPGRPGPGLHPVTQVRRRAPCAVRHGGEHADALSDSQSGSESESVRP
jgi:hypothetical protein